MVNCKYCGKEAKFKLKSGANCCTKSPNSCPANKAKNAKGLKQAYADGNRIKGVGFTPEARAKSNANSIREAKKSSFGENISRLTKYSKQYLLEERGAKCECCGVTEWNNKPLTFEVDHIDGDNTNNVKDNLRILCPNCHSQTDTWRGRNINKGKKKFSADDIVAKYLELGNIHQTLIAMGMAPKGANYVTVRRALINKGIQY